MPSLVEEIVPGGEKNTWWGVIFGIGAIWAVIGPALFGRLSETGSASFRKVWKWIAIGSGMTCIALGVVGAAQNLWILGLGYLLMQLSDDVGTGPYAGMVAGIVPEEHRGYSSSILGGLKLFAQIASAIIAMILGKVELILIGIGSVNVLCALITISRIKTVANEPEESPKLSFVQEYLAPFKSHDFRFVWLNRFVVSFAFAAISSYARNYLSDAFLSFRLFSFELKDANQAAQILALTISFAGILGSAVAAGTTDKYGRKPVLIISALLASFALATAVIIGSFTPLWVAVFVFGIGYGAYIATDWALASDILPNRDRPATEMGAWQSSETSVQIFAGLILGWMIDTLNRAYPEQWYGYKAMIMFAATGFLLSTLFVFKIRGTR